MCVYTYMYVCIYIYIYIYTRKLSMPHIRTPLPREGAPESQGAPPALRQAATEGKNAASDRGGFRTRLRRSMLHAQFLPSFQQSASQTLTKRQ